MYVVGTAGHVDHGKSALVQALTGIDPDRLKEEKEREMTIDLGFAWMKPGEGQEEIGIVDVPGHRDFIENMLAGVGGIDLALLVVAADEGVMPQTREHLAILDLLEVRGGVVALSKIDLVEDPDWLELVMLDVTEALAGTVLANAPLIPVSARTGAGLERLQVTLFDQLQAIEPKKDTGRARLPIDRVFSLTGFGTVVTGTLVGGRLNVGDAVQLHPGGGSGRVRGLQTHQTKIDTALPGSRVAVNLTGIPREDIRRGQVLAKPGVMRSTVLCDVRYRHLPSAGAALKHNAEVKFFVGSAEVMARTRVIGAKHLEPGQSGWLQVQLTAPVAILRGDRFILRRPSPGTTLGGGEILDPHPGRRHRRFRADITERLETLARGAPVDLLMQALTQLGTATRQEIVAKSGLSKTEAESGWQELVDNDRIVEIGRLIFARDRWQELISRASKNLAEFQNQFPMRPGMPREQLRSQLKLPASAFNSLVAGATAEGTLIEQEALLHLPGHEVRFSPAQEEAIKKLMHHFSDGGVNSPSVKEAKNLVGEDVYYALIDTGRLRQISDDVVYAAQDYERIIADIEDYLRKHGPATASQIRDLLDTSRKYAIALLEHLDEIRVTRRVGDSRELIA